MMSSVYDIGEGELEADPHYPAYPLGNYSSMISRVSLSLYLSLDFSLFISLSLSLLEELEKGWKVMEVGNASFSLWAGNMGAGGGTLSRCLPPTLSAVQAFPSFSLYLP